MSDWNLKDNPAYRYTAVTPPSGFGENNTRVGSRERCGANPWGTYGGGWVEVAFDGSNRRYTYWAPSGVIDNADDIRFVRVFANGALQDVRITGRGRTQLVAAKRIAGVYFDNRVASKTPQPTTEKAEQFMGIKIENQTLVNGRDVKEYADKELYSLLAESQREIDKLEALPVKPKRLLRQIEEYRKAQADLVALIDADEAVFPE